MGWLDNVVATISPATAYKRECFRQALEEIKSYDAGNYEKTNRNWRVSNSSAELTDRYSRDNVRARARDLERNSDMMNSILSAFKRNVVGGGYRVQARTADDEINKTIEAQWLKWCKKKHCDITETQSLNQIIRMAVERKKVDGGVLIVKTFVKDEYIPFKLQLLEVDELDLGAIAPKHEGNKVVGGIEYNQYNKAVGYFIRQYDIEGYGLKDPIYIDAKNVIFYFSKKRPSQLREMSDMAQTVPRIRDINEFITAVSVKERIEACLSVFIKRQYPTTGIGRTSSPQLSEERKSYDGKTLTPGMIKELNVGDEVQVVNPSGQGTDATTFTKLQQRLIGAGQGVSYEATSRDMSESTYSSTRQGLIEDELTYKEEKELLIEVLDEIYETFVMAAVMAGVIKIKDFELRKDEYLLHEWVQEPKAWIDPYKESNANKVALQSGQKTFKQIAAENGKDWREQIKDMAEVIDCGNQYGLDLGGVIFGNPKTKEESEKTSNANATNGNKG